jgi:PiT family inorganic phosphate transporter
MPDSLPLLITIFVIAIGFAIVNGVNDAANAIATVISTRVLSPRVAIGMAALLNMAGAATGTAVALTIGKGIIDTGELGMGILLASLLAVIIWTLFATYLGLPVSLSHGLVAGLVGAGMAVAGSSVIIWSGFGKVLAAVASAPIMGFLGGLLVMAALLWGLRRRAPARVRGIFSKLQILSAAFLAYAHGKNDGQMPMGVMVMALVVYSGQDEYFDHIPWGIIIGSAVAISLGTAIGGWRVIKTVGTRITKLDPVQGFAANSSAAAVIEVASWLGIPVSTTHCISSSIMGVGATKRLSAVRWGVAGNIVMAWILTFPICAALGWLLGKLFGLF